MKCSIWLPVLMVTAMTAGASAQMPSPGIPSTPAPAGSSETQAPSSVGPAKIAVVAFQAAVTKTNEFQRSFAELQKKYEPKRDALKALNDQIDALTKELQATDSKLTDQQKADKARQLDAKKTQFDRDQQDDQNDFSQEMQQQFQTVGSKVYDVLSSYAQQHGYTLVLDVAGQANPVMYLGSPTMDITNEVVAAYNAKSGVAPPPTSAPAATRAPATKPPARAPAKGAAKPQ